MTSVPPRDARQSPPLSAATAASILADTDALRRVFNSEFPGLVASAEGHLGQAVSLSSRVAEGSLVRAWDARDRLHTLDELRAFLADDVKAAADRALSRREVHPEDAAQKHAQVDMSQSWAHILEAIRVEPHTAQAEKMVADAARHEAAEAVVTATTTTSWRLMALIGVVAVALALLGVYLLDRVSTEKVMARAMASPDGKLTTTPYGQIADITLVDGTKVRLAPDSKLLVPKVYGDNLRGVKLDGGGAFDVAQGAGDFRVYTRAATLIAKGTRFVVAGLWHDGSVTVQVREGFVDLRVGKTTKRLTANQAAFVDTTGAIRQPSADEVTEATSWADGRLVIPHRSLREVLPALQRWFQLDVTVRDMKLMDRITNVNASVDSARVAISQVEKSAGVKLVNEGTRMIFQDTVRTTVAPLEKARKR